MRALLACACLAACGGPVRERCVPAIPPIPVAKSERWACLAPGAPAVTVDGAEPELVVVGGVELTCSLVPLR